MGQEGKLRDIEGEMKGNMKGPRGNMKDTIGKWKDIEGKKGMWHEEDMPGTQKGNEGRPVMSAF